MDSASESKKLQAAFKRLRTYIFLWGVAVFFTFARNFANLSELNNVAVLRLFSLLFFLVSIEGIYFKYYWGSKIGYIHTFFSQPRLDEVRIWQGKTAVIFGVLYALLAFVLLMLSFG